MTQYINKAAIVANLKRRLDDNMDYYKSIIWEEIKRLNKSYNDVLSEINSMKVMDDFICSSQT